MAFANKHHYSVSYQSDYYLDLIKQNKHNHVIIESLCNPLNYNSDFFNNSGPEAKS